MTDNRLILTATNPESVPLHETGGVSGLIQALQENDFIGSAVDPRSAYLFNSGVKIMNCISLVGCSPVYALNQNPGDDPAGLVSFSPVYDDVQFIYGTNSLTPKCPECRESINTWRQSLPAPLQACNTVQHKIKCDHCEKMIGLDSLRFRREAAIGRFFIFVHGIYPHEGVPMDAFLDRLGQYMGSPVTYLYCQGK